MEMRGQLKTVEAICLFMFAGNATVTLRSKKSGARFTYKITPHKERNDWHWVALMTGPDNEGDFQSFGYFRGPDFFLCKNASREAPSTIAFQFLAGCILKGKLHEALEVFHEGRCGACGRKLTVPESVATGFGPDCSERLGIPRITCDEPSQLEMAIAS
jgi:hypothetical protein